ncbi:MAG: hypothetical protein LBQ01_04840, partial [Prevotellaceae bacterium]|nr:hypothetical protein [Prevotellaceae bacterium]
MKTLLKTAGKILLHLGAILLMSLVIFIIEGIVGIIIQTNAGWGGKDYFDDSVLGDISLGQLVIITVLILWITALIRRIRRPALRRINAATVALKIFLYLLAFFP